MKPEIILIEMLVFALLFTSILFIYFRGDKKYSAASIHNYPPDIQKEYFKTHEKVNTSYKSKNVIFTKCLGLIIFIIILTLCCLIAKASSFSQGFILSFGLMAWIGIYDTFFLDWILFAKLKMFRLEGTEHMDEAYGQKWFHLKGMIFPGSLFALIVGVVVGIIIMFINRWEVSMGLLRKMF